MQYSDIDYAILAATTTREAAIGTRMELILFIDDATAISEYIAISLHIIIDELLWKGGYKLKSKAIKN